MIYLFKKSNNYQNEFYNQSSYQQLNYMQEETYRKLRNLNNRIRRMENYLGLRENDKFDEDIFQDD